MSRLYLRTAHIERLVADGLNAHRDLRVALWLDQVDDAGAIAAAVTVLAVFIAFQLVNACLLVWIETATMGNHVAPRTSMASRNPLSFGTAVVLMQLVHCLATIQALWLKTIQWRGIRYRVANRRIEMLEYRPFQPTAASDRSIC